MKTKQMTILCSILAMLLLSGCSLAQNRMGDGEDQLIGVVIAQEHFDLGDNNRLYATVAKENSTNEKNGENIAKGDYVFSGINGISYYEPTVKSKSEADSYRLHVANEAFCISNQNVDVKIADNTNLTTYSSDATLYILPPKADVTIVVYPVYQEEDGDVYMVSNFGIGIAQGMPQGDAMSTNLSASSTTSENSKSTTTKYSIKISVKVLYTPEKIRILEMNKNGGLLARKEYAPNQMPKSYLPGKDTAFLVVETHYKDGSGADGIDRKIYSKGAAAIKTFHAREDGYCIKDSTEIKW